MLNLDIAYCLSNKLNYSIFNEISSVNFTIHHLGYIEPGTVTLTLIYSN
jgi:hypothetical protein